MATPEKMHFGRYDIAGVFTFASYAASSVVIPVVLVALAKDLHFPLAEGGMGAGGLLHLGRSVTMVAAMLFCGFAAARFGLRRTLGVGVLIMAVGVGFCAVSPWYLILLAALLFTGCGEGIIEGLGTPFIQELHPRDAGRYINFTHGFWSLGVTITVLAAGALLMLPGFNWRWIVGGVAVVSAIPALLLLFRENPRHRYPERPEPGDPRQVFGHAARILGTPRFWLFFAAMVFAGGGEFCLTFWCASFIQLNFAASALAGGIGTASFAMGMFIGRTGWGYLIRQSQLKYLIVYSAIAGTLLSLAIPQLDAGLFPTGSPLLLWILNILLFLAGLATAPFWPSVQSYCADRMPEADTTMLFILLSCAGVPGCGIFAYAMGIIGDLWGMRISFYLVPFSFAMLAALIAADWFAVAHSRSKSS